ncbi:LOW QUALITY PROTEIN: sphingosine-1-phosphate lyase [Elysia marginata]|uniref:Sphingosine-1-phosphate lyase n=1 Tax=Elysia marginata TaxID=1093978 RepID=A0AAV4JAU5_9GAST|nr:LOW QUALITY PROTEIN: sphingosine-1-phosphate lyase [Elysia marginata]
MVQFWGKRKRPKLLQRLFWRWIFIWTSLFLIFPNCGQSITPTKITPNSLTTSNISQISLLNPKMSPNSLITPNKSPNSLTTPNKLPNSLTSPNISANSLTTLNISANSLTTPNISPNSLTTPNISPDSMFTPNMSPNFLTTPNMSLNSLTAPNMSLNSLTAPNMSPSLIPNFNTSMNSLPTSSVPQNGLPEGTMNVSGLGSVDSFSNDDSTNSRTNRSANLLKNSSKVFSDLIFQPDHLFAGNSETTTQADILEESSASDNPISCIERCGDNLSFPCSCTDVCVVNGNCCPDMANHCHSSFESGSSRFRHLRDAKVECSSMTSTFMVVSCPNHLSFNADKASSLAKEDMADRTVPSDSRLKRSGSPTSTTLPSLTGSPTKSHNKVNSFFHIKNSNVSDPQKIIETKTGTEPPNAFLSLLLDTPVTDITTGLVYRNQKFARCNGVLDLHMIFWAIQIPVVSLRSNPVGLDGLNEFVSTEIVDYNNPVTSNSKTSDCIPKAKRQCKKEWLKDRPALESMCLNGRIVYYKNPQPLRQEFYKNIYCFICNVGSSHHSEPVFESNIENRNFRLSLVASLSTSGALSVRAASGKSQLSWTSIECSVSAENHGGGNCKSTKCIQNFEQRPDGICRTPAIFKFAVNGGDCTFLRSKETDRKILSLIKCYLESYRNAELDAETAQIDSVYDFQLNLLFIQLSALVYYPLNPDPVWLDKILSDLSILIYDENLCCDPHPLPTVCMGDSCLHGDLEVSIVKTIDVYQTSRSRAKGIVDREKRGAITNNSLTVCTSILRQRPRSIETYLYCLHEPIYASQLDGLRSAANVSCFGENVGNRAVHGQQGRMCNGSYSSFVGLWLTVSVLVKVLSHT